jgi:hypothetical protein
LQWQLSRLRCAPVSMTVCRPSDLPGRPVSPPIERPDWWELARCRGLGVTGFTVADRSPLRPSWRVEVCVGCPVRAPCARTGLELTEHTRASDCGAGLRFAKDRGRSGLTPSPVCAPLLTTLLTTHRKRVKLRRPDRAVSVVDHVAGCHQQGPPLW